VPTLLFPGGPKDGFSQGMHFCAQVRPGAIISNTPYLLFFEFMAWAGFIAFCALALASCIGCCCGCYSVCVSGIFKSYKLGNFKSTAKHYFAHFAKEKGILREKYAFLGLDLGNIKYPKTKKCHFNPIGLTYNLQLTQK
jgi:hypothetical protein